jgi:DNA polymerase-3 subunit alpha
MMSDWGPEKKYKAQQEILGVSLEFSPLEQFADQIQSSGAISTLEAQKRIDEKVRVAGMRQTYRRFRTKSNQMMAFFNIEDFEGSLQIRIPPYLYRKHSLDLQDIGPFIIEGIIKQDAERQSISMTAEVITLLKN